MKWFYIVFALTGAGEKWELDPHSREVPLNIAKRVITFDTKEECEKTRKKVIGWDRVAAASQFEKGTHERRYAITTCARYPTR